MMMRKSCWRRGVDVFDSHVNLSESGKWFDTNLTADYSYAVDALDEAGIARAALLAMPGVCTNAVFERDEIDRERFWCIGNLDLSCIQYSIDQIVALDLDGVKIHPRIQGVGIPELIESSVFEKLEKLGRPVIICGWQQSSTVEIADLSPLLIDQIARRHPGLRIMISHLGGHRYWDAFMVARSNSNVYLDSSYFFPFFCGTSLEKDFLASLHRIDQKVVFGSDFPEVNPRTSASYLFSVTKHLSKEQSKKLFSSNLEMFFN